MMKNETDAAYFDWMCGLVAKDFKDGGRRYRNLLETLNRIDFRYSIPLDSNREADGIDLRYRFGYEKHVRDYVIARYLDDHPCSVLEMMIALAQRCEESIMDDPEAGNRTGVWFWAMISNLGLECMSDDDFDELYVEEHIQHFLDRQYSYQGDGGLFFVRKPPVDMRRVEIWTQLNWYLNEND